ncbi:MAG: nitrilase-related carbon-nitrogen hydrolase [Phycisphaerae bacterium]
MRVLAVQPDTAWEDKPANFDRVGQLVNQADPPSGSLVVLPEMFATGYSMNVEDIAEEPGGPTEQFLADLAARSGCAVAGGLVLREADGRGLNCVTVFSPEGLLGRYAKLHPFSFAHEHEHYAAGSRLMMFRWAGMNVAPLICYDLRFPEAFRALVRGGAEVFLVPANWPAQRALHWRVLLTARAIEDQAFVVGVNRTGSDPNVRYAGGSAIINGHGEPLAGADDEECTLAADLDAAKLRDCRIRFGALADMRNDLFTFPATIERHEA